MGAKENNISHEIIIQPTHVQKELLKEPVGVLGTGVPRLAYLRPTAWLHQRPYMDHLHQQTLKTLARGQATRGG